MDIELAEEAPKQISSVVSFISGATGGVCQVITGHPFDTLKIKMVSNPNEYQSFLQSVYKIRSTYGMGGFFKGIGSPLVGFTFFNASLFSVYERTQKLLRSPDDPKQLPLHKIAIAGGITGGIVAAIEGPIDLFKTKMQTLPQGTYKNTLHAAINIFKEYGVVGVYQGYGATILRNIPANFFYFGGYEAVKRGLRKPGEKETSKLGILFAGGMGGVLYWTLTYPFDAIKSSMQSEPSLKSQRKYKSWFGCVSQLYKTYGMKAFTRGFVPCVLRSFPSNATCFLGYEIALSILT